MKTLHLYTIRELLGPIIISGLFFTCLLLLVRLSDLAELLFRSGISLGMLAHLLGIVFLTLLSLTVPMAVLLGTIIAVGRMTTENEILAVRVAGVSVVRLFWPAVFCAAVLSFTLIWVNQVLIPRSVGSIDQIGYQIRFELLTTLEPGRIYTDIGTEDTELALTFEDRRQVPTSETGVALGMRGVSMRLRVQPAVLLEDETVEDEQKDFMIFAESGVIEGDPATQLLKVSLREGVMLPLGVTPGQTATTMRFRELSHTLTGGTRDLRNSLEVRPREMDYRQLQAYLAAPPDEPVYKEADTKAGRRIGRPWREYFSARNEYLRRYSLAFAPLAFVLISIPLAMEIRPRAKSLSFLIALVLMAVYYALWLFGGNVGTSGLGGPTRTGWLIAITALMVPNVVVGGIGFALFWRARWR